MSVVYLVSGVEQDAEEGHHRAPSRKRSRNAPHSMGSLLYGLQIHSYDEA